MSGHERLLLADGQKIRVACTCTWWTERRMFARTADAAAAFAEHARRQSLPPACPMCGGDGPTCAQHDPATGERYLHEIVCDVVWADDLCARCEMAQELEFLPENAARISRRMLGAAS